MSLLCRSIRCTSPSTTVRSRFVAASAVLFTLGVSASSRATPAVDEVTGVHTVCTASPAVAAARAERLAGEAAVISASVLPNPQASIQHQRALSGSVEHETIIGASVPFGIGGRRFLLQDAASARREQAQAAGRFTLFDAAIAFREAYIAAVLDEARVAALEEQQRALDTLAVTIEGLAKRGESTAYSQKRHAAQANGHRRLLTSMKARAAASRINLEAWLGEEVTLPPISLSDLAGGKRENAATTATHPQIASYEAAARASAIEARAANRSWIPDVTVFAGYRTITGVSEQPAQGISMSVTIPLTMFDHGQGEAALAEANRARAQAAADSLRREQTVRLKAATNTLALLEASIADVDQAATDAASLGSSAVKLYAAGEATIAEVLDAFRAAEEAQLAGIELAEEITRARLARMKAAGTQFDKALDQACSGSVKGAVQ